MGDDKRTAALCRGLYHLCDGFHKLITFTPDMGGGDAAETRCDGRKDCKFRRAGIAPGRILKPIGDFQEHPPPCIPVELLSCFQFGRIRFPVRHSHNCGTERSMSDADGHICSKRAVHHIQIAGVGNSFCGGGGKS